jgi:TonB family protein
MAVPRPSKTAPKVIAKPAKPAAPQESAETDSAFADRMAKLERNSEARREEAVLEKLRGKVKTGGGSKVGMPGAGGSESGSRYADYIKSRLEDALKVTSSYTTKSPEVTVRLTIAVDGRLSRMKIERSSGDATFELAVRRAIDLASVKFTAPPNRSVFENGFVFKPKGISNGTSR